MVPQSCPSLSPGTEDPFGGGNTPFLLSLPLLLFFLSAWRQKHHQTYWEQTVLMGNTWPSQQQCSRENTDVEQRWGTKMHFYARIIDSPFATIGCRSLAAD